MAFTKIFGTTAGAYNSDALWRAINVRSSAYSWTVSGSGTAEYYLKTAGGANPGFVASPLTNLVFLNGVAAAKGTLGSLSSGQFGFGDNDTLGYSTLYVRIGSDPDGQVDGYVTFKQSPLAAENVRFLADSGSINSATGLDQSAVAINDFIVEEGYQGTIGNASIGYLLIDPDRFEFNGRAESWINLTTAAIPVTVKGTAAAAEGYRGLYLKGTALTIVSVSGGSVGLAVNGGEISTATTTRLLGTDSSLWCGNGVTLTNHHQFAGNGKIRCAVSGNVILYDGSLLTEENGAIGTVTQKGGLYTANSTGTITAYNIYGGTLDEQKSGAARTITALNKYRGNYQILRNKEAVTHTAETPQDSYNESVSV
jgi:hypothetical protein